MVKKLNCVNCRKTFETFHHSKVFCSGECRTKFNSSIRNTFKNLVCLCNNCGKEFLQTNGSKLSCSKKCLRQFYVKQNPSYVKAENHKRRARIYNNNLLPSKELSLLIEEHKKDCFYYKLFVCFYCYKVIEDKSQQCLDHFIPLVKGGANDNLNIVLSCRSCNSKKHKKFLSCLEELERFQCDCRY